MFSILNAKRNVFVHEKLARSTGSQLDDHYLFVLGLMFNFNFIKISSQSQHSLDVDLVFCFHLNEVIIISDSRIGCTDCLYNST